MIRNLRYTVTIDSVLGNSKTQNAFLFTVNAIFRHDYPIAIEPGSTPRPLVQKKTWRDSVPVDKPLSAVSVLVVAQSSSEIPEELLNNPVHFCIQAQLFKSVHTQNKRMYWVKYDSALYLFIPRTYNKNSWMVYLSSGIIQDCFFLCTLCLFTICLLAIPVCLRT